MFRSELEIYSTISFAIVELSLSLLAIIRLIVLLLKHLRFAFVHLADHVENIPFSQLKLSPLSPRILVRLHLCVRRIHPVPLQVMLLVHQNIVYKLLYISLEQLGHLIWNGRSDFDLPPAALPAHPHKTLPSASRT